MNGCILWSRLEQTFESAQILEHVLKMKVQELASLSCEKAECFTQFVRDFMKLCETCTAHHETIRKLNCKDMTWTLLSTEKEWKESFASKTSIAPLQTCRNRCEQSTMMSPPDTISEFQGNLLEHNEDARIAFETSTHEMGTRKPREEKAASDPKKDDSAKDASCEGAHNDNANARAEVFGEFHEGVKGVTENKMVVGKKVMELKKSDANTKSRRRKATAEGNKPPNKRKRGTKAKDPNENYGSDDGEDMPDVNADPNLRRSWTFRGGRARTMQSAHSNPIPPIQSHTIPRLTT